MLCGHVQPNTPIKQNTVKLKHQLADGTVDESEVDKYRNGLAPRCGCAPHALSNSQMAYFLSSSEKPTDVVRAREALAPHSNSPRVGPTVVVALLGVCQGSVGGCQALDVLVAVVEVARAGRQSASGRDQYRVAALCSETQFSKYHLPLATTMGGTAQCGPEKVSDFGPMQVMLWSLTRASSVSSSLLQALLGGKALLSVKVADKVVWRILFTLA